MLSHARGERRQPSRAFGIRTAALSLSSSAAGATTTAAMVAAALPTGKGPL